MDRSREPTPIELPGHLPSVCFVVCVESGGLEAEAVRLMESLRRFGGALGGSEVFAVTPRFGPPLATATRQRFRLLGAEALRLRGHPDYAWYHFMNKPVALSAVERITDAEIVAFLDSDVLVTGAPDALAIGEGIDFAAAVTDTGLVGTTGPASEHEAHWRNVCAAVGFDLDELPWVEPTVGDGPIRLYFNGGVFAYRRTSGYGEVFGRTITEALDARTGFPGRGELYIEQMCIGLAALRNGGRWHRLPSTHNYTLLAGSPPPGFERAVPLGTARLLHYHDSMRAAAFATTLNTLSGSFPDVRDWLASQGPLTNPASAPWRAGREALRLARGLPRKVYRARMQTG